jgi:uncharacterized protein (TIGR00255 family)
MAGLHSMTGFGRASADAGDRRLHVEIRSLNHRGLDLKIRSREADAYCDHEIGRAVRAALERGAVSVQLRDESRADAAGLDEPRVRAVHATLERLRQDLEIEEPVSLATVAAFLNAGTGDPLAGERLWEVLRPAVSAALSDLRVARAREGEVLAKDLAAHHRRIADLARDIDARAVALPQAFARRLQERLSALGAQAGLDPTRLAQEVALLAERLDVTEEIVRLGAHLTHFADLLAGGGPVGRKLDFVIQEIGRELNTIASKAQDAGISTLVIEAKATLEKLREQAQNVE